MGCRRIFVSIMKNIKIATCQFPVSLNIARNVKYIGRLMENAADVRAEVVHFPETALSGYGRTDFAARNLENWRALQNATDEIVALATSLDLWVIFGSCRRIRGKTKPANCVYVISSEGKVHVYDKQKLTPSESSWYEAKAGKALILDIQGVKCGFLICYEACFPKLWDLHEKRGVQLIFHSGHNISSKPRPLLQELTLAQLRTRAADHGFWISHSTSSAKQAFSSALITQPDGSITAFPKHRTGMLIQEVPTRKDGDSGKCYT